MSAINKQPDWEKSTDVAQALVSRELDTSRCACYRSLMCAGKLIQVHPIVGSRDLDRTVAFYVGRLGFELAFEDGQTPRNYIGMRRDDVELHFQFQYEGEMGTIRLRILVSDPDALLADLQANEAFAETSTGTVAQVPLVEPLRDTPWGTREFGFYDPDGNELHFYRDLR